MFESKCDFCGAPTFKKVKNPTSFCNYNCKSEFQRLRYPVTTEWLRQKYEVEGLSCPEIAKIIGRNSKGVWRRMQSVGIKTRKRGEAENWRLAKHPKGWKMSDDGRQKIRAARIKDGRVPCYVNGVHWTKAYPDRHVATWRGGITPERQAAYSTPEWKSAVKTVWKRDNATCQECGKKKSAHRDLSFDIHHIVSFECIELRFEPSNLILLCEPCHYWAHGKENKEGKYIIKYERAK